MALQPLNFARRPYPDELPTSWLECIAATYQTTWHDLQSSNDGYPDISDYRNTPRAIVLLEHLTRMPRNAIQALELAKRFPGQPLYRFACHPDTGQAAASICDACFIEDAEAGRDQYLRYSWAIGGVSHCHRHRRMLRTTCRNCAADLFVHFETTVAGVRVCCAACTKSPALSQWQYRKQDTEFTIAAERQVLAALRGSEWRSPWLGMLEDIAFLLFYTELPAAAGSRRLLLDRWGGDGLDLVSPALKKKRLLDDCSLLFPLASARSTMKASLVTLAAAIICRQSITEPSVLRADMIPTLESLFTSLSYEGREELVRRSTKWPERFRGQVREIINTPMTSSSRSRYDIGQPWATCDARREMNGGTIPDYAA